MLHEACDVEVWPGELPPPRNVLLEKVRDVDGLLSLLTDKVDDELLDAAPKLRVVANLAVGFDNIDVDACTRRGVLCGNTPGVLTETTADFAFALLMSAARRVVEGDRYTREGKWRTLGPAAPARPGRPPLDARARSASAASAARWPSEPRASRCG